MTDLTPLFLSVLLVAFLAVLVYLKRPKLEDRIVVFFDQSEFWIDPLTIPGLVLPSAIWGKAYLCPVCEDATIMTDSIGDLYCDNTSCQDFEEIRTPEEIAPTMVDLFGQLSDSFTGTTRHNGDEIRILRDGSEEWMRDAIHEAHGDSLPDDTVYQFCEKTADHLRENDRESDADDLRESIHEIEPDVYTSDLTSWLNERPDHVFYLNQVQEEFGQIDDGFQLLAMAQTSQIHEVAHSLLQTVEETRDSLVSDLEDLADDLAQDVADAEEDADAEEEE